MRTSRRSNICRPVLLGMLAASCGLDATGPDARTAVPDSGAPSNSLQTVELPAVRLRAPRAATVAQAQIDARGGSILLGDVRIVIPPGAVTRRVWITLTLPAGEYAEVEFEPHGLTFRKPVQLVFSLANTEAADTDPASLRVAYTTVPLQQGTVRALEVLLPSAGSNAVSFAITHFSKYVLTGYILVGG